MPDAPEDSTPADASPELRIELAGRPLSVRIRREGRVRSPHTGRELRELHSWISISEPDKSAWLAGALRGHSDEVILSTDGAGEPSGRWLVSWNSYAESAGLHTYTLILREREELSLEALLLGELELHPYEYREQMVGDGLAIWMKLVGTEEDLEALRARVGGREAFTVVRRGIQDEPREMTLGVAEWSVFEDRIKYRLVLVDAEMNEEMCLELARIEEENSRAALGYYENFVERLAELLVQRGVLRAVELRAVRDAARASQGTSRRELWRVPDVDALR